MMHAFNSDAVYQQLFRSHWLAEWAQYNSSQYYAGDDGRYGLGAGPVKRRGVAAARSESARASGSGSGVAP